MRAQAHSFAKHSLAKKVIACTAAVTLVASMSYFHLWSTPQAIADDATVEVRFEVADENVTVTVGQQAFTADSVDAYEAATDANLEFSATASNNAKLAVAYQVTGGEPVAQVAEAKQPGAGLITSEEPEAETASVENSSDDIIYAEEVVEPIAETAAVLQEKSAREAMEADDVEETAKVVEETVEEDPTPMAAGIDIPDTGATSDEEMHVKVAPNDDGIYVIEQSVLADAAQRDAVVVVSVSVTDVKTGTVRTWEELKNALANNESVVLAGDITGNAEAITVQGTQTIDLNSYTIRVNAQGDNLFVVPSGASLTITDDRDSAKPVEIKGGSSELNGVLIPNPAKDPKRFAELVGKQATYDPTAQRLTYYITQSYTDRPSKGETEEYLYEHVLDLSGAGSLEVSEVKNLVKVEGGTFAIKGGLVSLAGGEHVVAANGGTVTMTGGAIVNSKGTNGAAINAVGATVEIAGEAILAGNTAKGDNNGGAIYLDKSSLTVSGNALLAGNRAGEEVYKSTSVDASGNVTDADYGTMSGKRNGGAIYAVKESNVTVCGSAIVAGNTAYADGGGIYMMGRLTSSGNQKANTLTLEGDVFVSNNRSENDKSDLHFTERTHQSSEVDWRRYGGGGGGLFTMDKTIINGAHITGNYASDGGGGLLITSYAVYGADDKKWKKQYIYPLLQVEKAIFSSNYAGTSEGGGIHAITNKESYVKRGYITNNMTATPFDYGGGGLFLSSATHGKETGLTVIYPLVTKNTAKGFGGGVGICTNGVVVTADAAIFDNKALTENATTNPNEYGDQWAFDENYGLKEVAKRQEVEGTMQSLADDFFCAKESTVFNKMLGGGTYDWSGYTNGRVYRGQVWGVKSDGTWNVGNTLQINEEEPFTILNVLYNNKPAPWNITLHAPALKEGQILDLEGYKASFTTKNLAEKDPSWGTWSGVIEDVKYVGLSEAPSEENREYSIELNLTPPKGYLTEGDTDSSRTLIGAYTKVENGKPVGATNYEMYKISSFPDTEGAFAEADRLMFLKANPTEESKQAAYNKAVLFVTGNYSNTNGGGIACNDRIAIGRDPEVPEIPDVPEDPKEERIAALEISKTLKGFQESNGSATAVFEVVGYVDKSAADRQVAALEVYRNTIGFSFAADGTDKRTLNDVPEGYYVVRELSYSGDNFDNNQAQKNTWAGQVKGTVVNTEGDTPTEVVPVEVSFTNTYKDETYGTGVVNNYDKNGGTYTYTPDANYQKRHDELSTEEGR
ncbi:hypothetical protein [uncultured Adlercreutzia sp.]|uniref:hypothetical protein n=1 Tax=uncultured Adlercreutzia sp. TaxID=875803 RepID=UPI0026F3F0A7|nr:hypothetical protein [uncultured Adlercreutzia sp.]